MAAMGGSIQEARRYVDNMKKQESYRQNPISKINKRMTIYKANREREKTNFRLYHESNKGPRQKGFAAYYEANKEKVNQKRMVRFEKNKETEKGNFRAYHEANKESRQKGFRSYHEANKESRHKVSAAYYEDNIEKVNQKRMDRFEKNKETEKANFRAYHEANKEPRHKDFAVRYEANKENIKAIYQANKEEILQSHAAKSGRYGPIFPCIVCHELHWRSNVVVVNFDDVEDEFLCTEYVISHNSLFMKLDSYYCCKTCKKKTDGGEMPKVAAVNNMKCPWDKTPQSMLKFKVRLVFCEPFMMIFSP